MKSLKKALVVANILLLALTSIPVALAQPSIELHGLSFADVEKHLGRPDQKKKTQTGKITWTYGRSIILFRDGKISAWSDAGELVKRMKRAKLGNVDSRAKQEHEHWKNPWTQQESLSDSQLLDELVAQIDN